MTFRNGFMGIWNRWKQPSSMMFSRRAIHRYHPNRRLFSTTPSSGTTNALHNLGIASYIATSAAGGILLYYYLSDSRALFYEAVAMPLLHTLYDAEESHNLSIQLCKYGLVPKDKTLDPPSLAMNLWGKSILNPIGLAAGYDKHGEGVDSLLEFGFGLVEVGSVTPRPQEGNPKPRFFRLPQDKAVINRYGFNSHGHDAVFSRLLNRIRDFVYRHPSGSTDDRKETLQQSIDTFRLPDGVPRSLSEGKLLGLNLGKNKTSPVDSNQDYLDGIQKLGPFADYLVINVSSPNTKGLRSLQARDAILSLLSECKKMRDTTLPHRPPLLVKIAPDLTHDQIQDIATVVKQVGIDGVIISNTTISRPDTLEGDPSVKSQFGGLSGVPLKPLSLAVVSEFYKHTQGSIPIIGCGGISSAQDAVEFAKAGASLVQLYTALGYQGPGLIPKMKTQLVELLEKEGVSSWKELIGKNHRTT